MKKVTTLILLLTFYCLCRAQVPDLTNWKVDTLPTGDRIYLACHSKNDWVFVEKNGQFVVVQNDYKREKGDTFPFSPEFIDKNLKEIKGNRFVKKVLDGYIVGQNNGEFGGGLYFINNDGYDGYEMARYINIANIFEYKSRLFAIEGLAHLIISSGQIIEIYKGRIWKYKSLTKLIEAPAIIGDYKNEKIIITTQYILKFGKDLKVTEILKSPFCWGMLYPSTILFNKNDIYIAMRQGVLEIKSFDTSPVYVWYLPK